PESAITAVERAHAAAQNNQLITVGLIDLYIRQGANEKALTLARQENGNNDQTNFQLIAARARAEFAAGLKKEAAETYRRLIEIAPRQIGIRRQLATV